LVFEELLEFPAGEVVSIPFWPGASRLTKLDQQASLFEQYKLLHCEYKLSPKIGTTEPGHTIAGIDFDTADAPTSSQGVIALSPKVFGPVWSALSPLVVPPSKAMKGNWHYTPKGMRAKDGMLGATHAFCMFSDAPKASQFVMVKYSVRFAGPTGPQAVQTVEYTYDATSKKWLNQKGQETARMTVMPNAKASIDASSTDGGWLDSFLQSLPSWSKTADNVVGAWHRTTGYFMPNPGQNFLPLQQALRDEEGEDAAPARDVLLTVEVL
jgi:hypothetical protein